MKGRSSLLYDVSMLVLTIAGVVGIVVYSYKMSRVRVYPVGIVRTPLGKQFVAPSTAGEVVPVPAEPKPVVTSKFGKSYWAADVDIKDYFLLPGDAPSESVPY